MGALTNRSQPEREADGLLRELFPLNRSIMGEDIRETLRRLTRNSSFQLKSYPTGLQCFDWTIPQEWTIRDAYIKDSKGRRVVDFKTNNIHVMSHSQPFKGTMTLDELRPHLHTLPAVPDAIPYRTSYYQKDWAFCLSHRQLLALDAAERYDVLIDSTLSDGQLTLADDLVVGSSAQEFLISTYCCHPSMANDNLSGAILTVLLNKRLRGRKNRFSYRFLIAPETIGPIVYLSQNEKLLKKTLGGFVVATVGGPGPFGYKQTFLADHIIDEAVAAAFARFKITPQIYPFIPNGSDERQYSSPGFRLAMGTICKDKYYEYPFYHTSLDDLDFVKAEAIVATLEIYVAAIDWLEHQRIYRRLQPHGELQLGRRGLYPNTGGGINQTGEDSSRRLAARALEPNDLDALLWCLHLMNGRRSLDQIAAKSGCPREQIARLADILIAQGLIEAAP
jgi:aminopeptidase-like protein